MESHRGCLPGAPSRGELGRNSDTTTCPAVHVRRGKGSPPPGRNERCLRVAGCPWNAHERFVVPAGSLANGIDPASNLPHLRGCATGRPRCAHIAQDGCRANRAPTRTPPFLHLGVVPPRTVVKNPPQTAARMPAVLESLPEFCGAIEFLSTGGRMSSSSSFRAALAGEGSAALRPTPPPPALRSRADSGLGCIPARAHFANPQPPESRPLACRRPCLNDY